jgi:hypothetical protein
MHESIKAVTARLDVLQSIIFSFIGIVFPLLGGIYLLIFKTNRDGRKEIDAKIDTIFETISEERSELLNKFEMLDDCREEDAGHIIKLIEQMGHEKAEREKDIATIIRTCRGCQKGKDK